MIESEFTGEAPYLRAGSIGGPFNYDTDLVSNRTGLACPEPTLAKQEFKEESDINTIVERFGLTGELPTNVRMPLQEDFTEAVTDYHTALNMVMDAENNFMRLPANVRTRFDNDPGKLIAFMEDPANADEAASLGLVNAKQNVEVKKDTSTGKDTTGEPAA